MTFLDRIFGRRESKSRDLAKDRLQVILVHDRVDLSPGKMEQLKSELAEVISKYVAIDPDGIDISLTDSNRQSKLTAQIPVTGGVARQRK